MDSLHWLPGWIEADDSSFRELVDAFTVTAAWVIDGNYSVARDLVWPAMPTRSSGSTTVSRAPRGGCCVAPGDR